MRLLEWYMDLHWSARLMVALALLGSSTVMLLGFDRIWPWGWIVGALALVLSIPEKQSKWGDW